MSIKNMKITPSLPTAFARQIAIGVDLLPRDYTLLSVDDYEVDKTRLAQFQQLSVAGTFEEAMLAYHGLNLAENKLAALRLIYNTTKPWLLGHVVGEMLTRMEAIGTSSKEAADIAQMIVDAFAADTSSTEGTETTGKRGLLVKFAPGVMEVSNGTN